MRPWLFRPAWVVMDSTSLFSGSSVVISSNPEIVMKRRPGLVGLNLRSGIALYAPEQPFDLLARAQRHNRFLPIGRVADRADAAHAAALLAPHAHRVHVFDLDALRLVLLLERLLDLRLGGLRGDAKRVPALRVQLVGALGDKRADHYLGGGSSGHFASASSCCSWLPAR